MKPFLAAGAVLVAGTLWALRLILDPEPLSSGSGILVGLDLLILSVVATSGMLLARGRWTRRLAALVLAAQAGLALSMEFDALGIAALAATALGVVAMTGPFLDGWLRALPPGGAAPARASLLALGLLAIPGLAGLAAPSGPDPAHWVLAGGAAAIAVAYSRARPSALWGSRLLIPVMAGAAALSSPAPGALAIGTAGIALTALAWHPDARLAVSPLLPRVAGGIPVPPELVPPDVLRAAGYDERGRPREAQ